jgi:hypothetical protein
MSFLKIWQTNNTAISKMRYSRQRPFDRTANPQYIRYCADELLVGQQPWIISRKRSARRAAKDRHCARPPVLILKLPRAYPPIRSMAGAGRKFASASLNL